MDQLTALVIGGNGGIGRAVVKYLQEEKNAKVYATSRKDASVDFTCDLTSPSDIARIVDEIAKKESGIDLVVNTAAVDLELLPFQELPLSSYEENLELALGGISLTKAMLPLLEKREGAIIHILSEALALRPSRMSSYIVGKAALLGFIQSAGKEIAPKGIRILGFSPSFVDTDMLKAFPPKLIEIARQQKQILSPYEVADAIYRVWKEKENYVSGDYAVIADGELRPVSP